MKQYEHSTTSQWGEDGVIEEIFKRIGTTNRIAVDVGAWDGKHFSNTYTLWHDKEWSALLIEADEERAVQATALTMDYISVKVRNEKCTDLDKLLEWELPNRSSFDLLCIDIDGDDYYLWKDMIKYRPRVVVIEYNQTVPPHIDIVQERGGTFGASARALNRLARSKGYYCIHCTVTNMIFVADECLKQGAPPVSIEPNTNWLQYVVTGYNGKQYLIGNPAHNDNQGGKHERLITETKYKEI